jgi:fatty-acyl-CoA synthase
MEFNIGKNFELIAKRWGDRNAIICDNGETYTYDELNNLVNSVTRGFRDFGINQGDRIGLLLPNSSEFVISFFATQKLGAEMVPINFRLSSDEIRYIVNDAEISMLIYDPEYKEAASEAIEGSDIVGLSTDTDEFDQLYSNQMSNVKCPATREANSYIAYTSGSTGQPKGVPHTHDDVILGATQVIKEMGLQRSDIALQIAPLFHVVGLNCFFNPHWFIGATTVLQRDFNPPKSLELIEEWDVTGTLGVPAQIRALLGLSDIESYDLSTLRYIRTGGDPISGKTIDQIQNKLAENFYNTYGLTETQQNITVFTPDDPQDKKASVGKPSYYWDVRVVKPASPENADPTDKVNPPGQGMIMAKGPMLTDKYLNRPTATQETFIDEWLYTGDVAEIDEDGYINIIDRMDNMIKSGGENIYPQEIENVLGDHQSVMDCGVVGIESEKWGEAVTAAVVIENNDLTSDDLDEYLQSSNRLANFKRPRQYKFIENIPRNPGSGSIRRKKLREIIIEPE